MDANPPFAHVLVREVFLAFLLIAFLGSCGPCHAIWSQLLSSLNQPGARPIRRCGGGGGDGSGGVVVAAAVVEGEAMVVTSTL